ncbi:MAG: hypothetical protein EXS02_13495, partial [Planctomycetes bacterium]|nr:hypothetical protein [Planctomycetota bacterium]
MTGTSADRPSDPSTFRIESGSWIAASNRRGPPHRGQTSLLDALKRRKPGRGFLHHTDRGSPYASEDYRRLLDASGVLCSMSRTGKCDDNAAMESRF